MFVAFSRTLRSLKADSSRLWMVAVLFVALILACWAIWLLQGRVAIYAVSDVARLETERAVHPIQSLNTGRIAASYLVVGKVVRQGDVLIDMDANVQRLQVMEEQLQNDPLDEQFVLLEREIAAAVRAQAEEKGASDVGIAEAQARQREAEAAADYAALDVEKKSQLDAAGLISTLELARARTEALQKRAAAESLKLAAQRQGREQRTRTNERRSQIESLRRELSRLSAQQARTSASVDRLESEVGLRRIVASTDGVIGEVADLKVGAVVSAGEKLGAIIPSGPLKVVAQFAPAKTLGRIRKGQSARLRLAGFPWTQYGTLTATVTSVSNEVRDGAVRVELRPSPSTRVRLQHGLPTAVEVEVEHISPAVLLFRVAGQMLTPQKAEPMAAAGAVNGTIPEGQAQ